MLCSRSLVSLVDIAAQYETISKRRKETITKNILRTTSIRSRLKNRFDDSLHFEKLGNCEASKLNAMQPYVLDSIIGNSRKKRFQKVSDRCFMSFRVYMLHCPMYRRMPSWHYLN